MEKSGVPRDIPTPTHWFLFSAQNAMTEPIVRGYGRTSSSDSKSHPVTADTAFMLASVSKVFAGTAILKLVDLGILSSLDDDIGNVYQEVTTACRNPHFPKVPVTWRMLLTHRSSLRGDIPVYKTKGSDCGYLEASYGPTGGYLGLAAGQATCPMENVVNFYQDVLLDKESETTVGAALGIQLVPVGPTRVGRHVAIGLPTGRKHLVFQLRRWIHSRAD